MASSTSSSNTQARISARGWGSVFVQGVLLAGLLCLVLEVGLRSRGFKPVMTDNYELWASTLDQALEAGSNAVVFVGASRCNQGIHIPTLREQLPNAVVAQLCISNGSPLPALRMLAESTPFNGTVVVDVMPSMLFTRGEGVDLLLDPDYDWPRRYGEQGWRAQTQSASIGLDRAVSRLLQRHMVIASGAVGPRMLAGAIRAGELPEPPFYWITADRMQILDYSRVDAERFEQSRAELHGQHAELDAESLRQRLDATEESVSGIEARGGRVFFVRFPVKRAVHEVEAKRFPDERYWNVLAERFSEQTLDANQHRTLTQFRMTDADHIDSSEAPMFTRQLLPMLPLGRR